MRYKLVHHSLIVLFFLTIALLVTYPLITQFNTHLAGAPESDAYEHMRHIWWINLLLRHDPLIDQPLLGYPEGLETQWLALLLFDSFPAAIFAFVMPLAAAYNLALLFHLTLNGYTAYWLGRQLNFPHSAACLSGLILMTYPTVQGHLWASHVGLVTLWGINLYIMALLNLKNRYNFKITIYTVFIFLLNVFGDVLLLFYILLPINIFFIFITSLHRQWIWLRRILSVNIIATILIILLVIPFIQESTVPVGPNINAEQLIAFSTDLLGIVSPSFMHPIFGNWSYVHHVLGTKLVEGSAYIGIIAATLSLIAILHFKAAREWMLLACIMWIFSLGPFLKILDHPVSVIVNNHLSHILMPYALIAKLPVISMLRTPGRFNLTVGLAIAITSGYGFSWIIDKLQSPLKIWLVFSILVYGIIFEYHVPWSGWKFNYPGVSTHIADPIRRLANDNTVRAVFNIPVDNLLVAKESMFLQTAHHKPIIAGHIVRQTPVSTTKLYVLQNSLEPKLLLDEGIDIVIVFHQWYELPLSEINDKLGDPIHQDDRIAVYRVPRVDREQVPQFHYTSDNNIIIEQVKHYHLYASSSSWVSFDTQLVADSRQLIISLNNIPIRYLQLNGKQKLDIPIPLDAGFHTLSIALDPPCTSVIPYPTLICRSVQIKQVNFSGFKTVPNRPIIKFEHGINLRSSLVTNSHNAITINLWWEFSKGLAENIVRFIHVVDETNTLISADDKPLGLFKSGDQFTESIILESNLNHGHYHIYTGWYTYPDIQRLQVLSNVKEAQNNWVLINDVINQNEES